MKLHLSFYAESFAILGRMEVGGRIIQKSLAGHTAMNVFLYINCSIRRSINAAFDHYVVEHP